MTPSERDAYRRDPKPELRLEWARDQLAILSGAGWQRGGVGYGLVTLWRHVAGGYASGNRLNCPPAEPPLVIWRTVRDDIKARLDDAQERLARVQREIDRLTPIFHSANDEVIRQERGAAIDTKGA